MYGAPVVDCRMLHAAHSDKPLLARRSRDCLNFIANRGAAGSMQLIVQGGLLLWRLMAANLDQPNLDCIMPRRLSIGLAHGAIELAQTDAVMQMVVSPDVRGG